MKVILLADVKGTGKKGDVCEVSDGFARNMLFKKNLAKVATSVEVNSLKIKKEAEEFHRREEIKRLTELAKEINGKTVACFVKSGENGKIFGSVTTQEVSNALKEVGYDVDKKKIALKDSIKQLGDYQADIKLISGIPCKITVTVKSQQ
ncbi:MAG: 50S ribosomal protein L9 [Christensenellaceae bacterium]